MKKSIVMAIAMSLILVGSVQAQKKADQGVNLFDLGAKGIVIVKESPTGSGWPMGIQVVAKSKSIKKKAAF